MRDCHGATGCGTRGKLHQPFQLQIPAGIREEGEQGRQGSEKGQDKPETCMSPFHPSLHLILGSLPEAPRKIILERRKTNYTAKMEEIK